MAGTAAAGSGFAARTFCAVLDEASSPGVCHAHHATARVSSSAAAMPTTHFTRLLLACDRSSNRAGSATTAVLGLDVGWVTGLEGVNSGGVAAAAEPPTSLL